MSSRRITPGPLPAQYLPEGIRVGTVDKFQGQAAAVTFFSMATSSGAELPRNLEFLFSRNRLNVAVSQARCLAVLVCGPELLHVHLSLGRADAASERAMPARGSGVGSKRRSPRSVRLASGGRLRALVAAS